MGDTVDAEESSQGFVWGRGGPGTRSSTGGQGPSIAGAGRPARVIGVCSTQSLDPSGFDPYSGLDPYCAPTQYLSRHLLLGYRPCRKSVIASRFLFGVLSVIFGSRRISAQQYHRKRMSSGFWSTMFMTSCPSVSICERGGFV